MALLAGILRFLTTSANGEWWFEQISETSTSIKWRYAFNSRNFFAIPFLWFIAKTLWKCYMLLCGDSI
jgi:FPC/CPF motif-containing protein YcgG